MIKIEGCTRDNVKEVLHDLAQLFKGQLQYDADVVGDDKEVKNYSNEYHEKILLFGSLKHNNAYVYDMRALNISEIIDYIFWLLLEKKDFPLKNKHKTSTVKGYANVKNRSNPEAFLKGRRIEPEGAKNLANAMIDIIYPVNKDLEEHRKKFFSIEKRDKYKDDEDFYNAVAEHLAVLINDSRFMPSDSVKKANEIIFDSTKTTKGIREELSGEIFLYRSSIFESEIPKGQIKPSITDFDKFNNVQIQNIDPSKLTENLEGDNVYKITTEFTFDERYKDSKRKIILSATWNNVTIKGETSIENWTSESYVNNCADAGRKTVTAIFKMLNREKNIVQYLFVLEVR